jgi:acetolactate synthase-1/2/3 large subunit
MTGKPEQITAIKLLLKYLESENVKYIFGIPGGPLMPLYEAIHEQGNIRAILTKHEQGAAFMADGYARVSGGLGVCCATTGPGATNLMTGVTCAYADSVPLLVLTAQIATGAFGKGAVQESTSHGADVVDMFKPITKMSMMLPTGDKMADVVRLAIRTAMTGRRGPVHLSLPADLVKKEVPLELIQPDNYRADSACFDRAAIKEASRLLLKAQRPAILAGNGVNLSRSHPELRALAEKLMIPVCTSPQAKAAFPEDHSLSMGVFGFGGSPRADAYLLSGEVDVLLVVGTSLGEFSTQTWDKRLQPSSALIQIDIDPGEIGKNYRTSVGITGDAKVCLKELLYQVERDIKWLDNFAPPSQDYVRSFKEKHPRCLEQEKCLSDAAPLKPQRLVYELGRMMPEDSMLFVDIGNCIAWAVHYLCLPKPGGFFLNMGMASMGHAVASAIGGKLARPNSPAVVLAGDGSFAMNGMEVHTAVDCGVPVIWVILNNSSLGMVYHGEKMLFGGRFNFSKFNKRIDVAAVARGLGAEVFSVDSAEGFRNAFKACLKSGKPCVIDALVDPEECPPMKLRVDMLEHFFSAAAKNKVAQG